MTINEKAYQKSREHGIIGGWYGVKLKRYRFNYEDGGSSETEPLPVELELSDEELQSWSRLLMGKSFDTVQEFPA